MQSPGGNETVYTREVVRLNMPSAHADVDAWPEYATRHSFTMEPVARAGKKAFGYATAIHDALWFMSCTFLLLFTQSPEFRDSMKPAVAVHGSVLPHGVFVEGNTTSGVQYLRDVLATIGHDISLHKEHAQYTASIHADVRRLGLCRGNVGDVSVVIRITLFTGGTVLDSVSTVNRHRLLSCDSTSYMHSLSDFVRDILEDMKQDPYILKHLVFDSNPQ